MTYFVGYGGQVTIGNPGTIDLTVTFADSEAVEVAVYDDVDRTSTVTQPGVVAAGQDATFYFDNSAVVTATVFRSGVIVDTRVITVENGNTYSYTPTVSQDDVAHSLILQSPDGTVWSVSVDDEGALTTTDVTPT